MNLRTTTKARKAKNIYLYNQIMKIQTSKGTTTRIQISWREPGKTAFNHWQGSCACTSKKGQVEFDLSKGESESEKIVEFIDNFYNN